MFDNDKVFTPRKCKRNGKLSNVTLATSTMFVKSRKSQDIDETIFPQNKLRVQVTCISQSVPSAHGILSFELFDHLDWGHI